AMSSGTAIACRSRSTCHHAELPRQPPKGALSLARFGGGQLIVNAGGKPHQLLALEPAGERIGKRVVDPIKGAELAMFSKAKGRLGTARLLAHIKRQPPTIPILVHELRRGLAAVGQQPATDQLPALAAQFRRPYVNAQTTGQPLHQMSFFPGADLDGMA